MDETSPHNPGASGTRIWAGGTQFCQLESCFQEPLEPVSSLPSPVLSLAGHVSVPHRISTSSLPQVPRGPRLVPSTTGVDEDLHRPVKGVPVGQGDNDALGRACRRGSVSSDLVGGTLHPCGAQKDEISSGVSGEIGALSWGQGDWREVRGVPDLLCNHGQVSSIPHLQNGGLDR